MKSADKSSSSDGVGPAGSVGLGSGVAVVSDGASTDGVKAGVIIGGNGLAVSAACVLHPIRAIHTPNAPMDIATILGIFNSPSITTQSVTRGRPYFM